VLCSALAENRIDIAQMPLQVPLISGSPKAWKNIRVNVLTELSSDHLPSLLFELDEDAQSFRSVTKMLSPQANIWIFKEHIEATVELNIPIDTCSKLKAYVDYFTSAIIKSAGQATPTPQQVGLTAIRRPPILCIEARDFLSHKRRLRRQYIATGDPIIYQQFSSKVNNRKANLDTLLESAGPDSNSRFSI